MKKIYIINFLLSTVIFNSCSKDFLEKYDKRVIGSWHISDVNSFGLGGDVGNLPFTDGTVTFYDDGTLNYINAANISYQGRWDIVKKITDDGTLHSLSITAVNYSSMEALSQYYDDMNFTVTDHFKARIFSGFHTYVTSFRR
jgi:hypothetical protein